MWNLVWIALAFLILYKLFKNDTPQPQIHEVVVPSFKDDPHHYRNTKSRPSDNWEDDILYIVIHGTANDSSYADAKFHIHYLDTTSRKVSWHYTVDESGVYQSFPDSIACFHASSSKVNAYSIGVEVCHPRGWDGGKTIEQLTRFLHQKKEEYPGVKFLFHDQTSKVDPKAKIHGKICPRVFDSGQRQFILSRIDKPW